MDIRRTSDLVATGVSYYDYYQPEAYVPRSDTYIEKEATINEQIDRMRHSATRALLERRRCDHRRLGLLHLRHRLPETYGAMTQDLEGGATYDQRKMLRAWSSCSTGATTPRSSAAPSGSAAMSIEIFPPISENEGLAFRFFGDEIEKHHRNRPADRGEDRKLDRATPSTPTPTT